MKRMKLQNISVGNREITFNRKYNFFHNIHFEILNHMYSKFDTTFKLITECRK